MPVPSSGMDRDTRGELGPVKNVSPSYVPINPGCLLSRSTPNGKKIKDVHPEKLANVTNPQRMNMGNSVHSSLFSTSSGFEASTDASSLSKLDLSNLMSSRC